MSSYQENSPDKNPEDGMLPYVLLWYWALTGLMKYDVPDGKGGYFKKTIPIPLKSRLKAAMFAAPYFAPKLSAQILVNSSYLQAVKRAMLQALVNPFGSDHLSYTAPPEKLFEPLESD